MIYPLRYPDIIVDASREFRVDPFVIAAVIKVESNFQARALSRKGAAGLMQIMPDTALQAASKLGVAGYRQELLYDPRVNIRLGTWYLSHLIEEFDGELRLALAAYNGGPRNVKDWQRQGLLPPGGSTDSIPFKETRDFVDRVGNAVDHYRDLYESQLSRSKAMLQLGAAPVDAP